MVSTGQLLRGIFGKPQPDVQRLLKEKKAAAAQQQPQQPQQPQPGAQPQPAQPAPAPAETLPGDTATQVVEQIDETPPIVSPPPVAEQKLEDAVATRAAELGEPRQAPSPSAAMTEAGVVKGPINTRFYDSDELAATVQAMAKDVQGQGTRTVQSIYDEARNRGISQNALDSIFSQQDMTTKIGGNQIAVNMAALIDLHDASATQLDDLMARMTAGTLDEAGQLQLREHMARHIVIMDQMKSAQTDVARALNTFKRASALPADDLRSLNQALNEMGGETNLLAIANQYTSVAGTAAQQRAAKNKLLQRGLSGRLWDAAVYSAQSVLLSNPDTHLYNLAGTTLMLGADYVDQLASIPIGMTRQGLRKMFDASYDADRTTMNDVTARTLALYGAFSDGWRLMASSLKNTSGGPKGEGNFNPIRGDYLLSEELQQARLSGHRGAGALGNAIDYMGAVYSVPFKSLQAADEFVGGFAQRIQLHEDVQRAARKVFEDEVAKGTPEADALKIAQAAAQDIFDNPTDKMIKTADEFRKVITLQQAPDVKTAVGRTQWAFEKTMNHPAVKPMMMFNRTLFNIANEGSARTPILNFASPKFWNDYNAGGRRRDLAIGRVATGGMLAMSAYALTANGHVTGAGPSDRKQQSNLRASGWQQFSLVLGPGTYDDASVEKLRELLGADAVTYGRDQFNGKLFVSLSRLEPVSIPLLLAAGISDATNFSAYDPDETIMSEMVGAAALSLSEFSTNIPVMTAISELMTIAGNPYESDAGNKLTQIVTGLTKIYGNFALNATPGVNLANSALVAKIERMIDPSIPSTKFTEDQRPLGVDNPKAIAGVLEAWNRLRSRVPVYSAGVQPRLDAYGEEVGTKLEMAYLPAYMVRGEATLLQQYLNAIDYGIAEPNTLIDGVRMGSDVEYEYKMLYAKKIKLDGLTMDKAIIEAIKERADEFKKRGTIVQKGELQSEVDSIVSKYRAAARKVMFGVAPEHEEDQAPPRFRKPISADEYREYGLVPSSSVMYPDLADRMQTNVRELSEFGRTR